MNAQHRDGRLSSRARQVAAPVVAGLAVAACAAVVGKSASTAAASLYFLAPPCLLHTLTGLYCPGCGTTRAFCLLARGEVVAALGSNPLLVVLLPILAVLLVYRRTSGVWRVRLERLILSPVAGWGLVVLTVLFAVTRNLPFRACRWLAP